MDQSLDDIIAAQRKTNFTRGRGRQNNMNNSGLLPRRGRIQKRSSGPVWFGNPDDQWKHDMFKGARQGNQRSGHRIQISNLDFGVNDEDINELFREFGEIMRAGVHYDRSGRSMGTAEVIYVNKSSAIQARNKYNNIPLDNKPMKIALLDNSAQPRSIAPENIRSKPAPVRTAFIQRGGRNSLSRRGGFRNNYSNNRNQKSNKTKEQLDAEMDEYLAKTD